jgi:hypothetical protein
VNVFAHASDIAHPTGFTNEYAALPSFHVGWIVLVGVIAMRTTWHRVVRPLLLLPATVMFVVVMATANHYLLDGVGGTAIALVGLVAADRLAADVDDDEEASGSVPQPAPHIQASPSTPGAASPEHTGAVQARFMAGGLETGVSR